MRLNCFFNPDKCFSFFRNSFFPQHAAFGTRRAVRLQDLDCNVVVHDENYVSSKNTRTFMLLVSNKAKSA